MSKKNQVVLGVFFFVFVLGALVLFLAFDTAEERGEGLAQNSIGVVPIAAPLEAKPPERNGHSSNSAVESVAPPSSPEVKIEKHLKNGPVNAATAEAIYKGKVDWATFQQEFYAADVNARLTYARVAATGGDADIVKGILASGYLLPDQILIVANSALRAGHSSLVEDFFAHGAPVNGVNGGAGMLDALLLNKRELSKEDFSMVAFLVARGGVLSQKRVMSWMNDTRAAENLRKKISEIEKQGVYVPITDLK